MQRHTRLGLACAWLLAGLAASAAASEAYPSRPIRLVLTVGTGGVGDTTMRLVANEMSKRMGQQIVVDNRPGAGGVIAATAVLQANPDGYTLLQSGNSLAISASLFKSLPYDILRDFTQVSSVAFFELAVVATPKSRFGTLGELLAFAKNNPGKLDIGTTSAGSTQYLAAELLKSMAKIQAQIVPYKSNTQLLTALRGDELGVAVELLGPVLAHIRSGALRALAVGSARRFAGLPEVPTIAESGVPGFDVYSWTGISVPKGTPRPIVERLAQEVAAAVSVPEVEQRLQEMGIEARASTPERTREMMASHIARWKAVIERAKIERK